jgi:glucosamine-6-phosphate deaminase
MNPDIIITAGKEQNGETAGGIVVDAIAEFSRKKSEGKTEKEYFALGLPTGSSPITTYECIAEAENNGAINMSDVVCFNLDEYLGLPGKTEEERKFHRESYWLFMRENFYNKLKRQPHAAYIPPGFKFSTIELEEALRNEKGSYTVKGKKGQAIVIARNPFDNELEIAKSCLKRIRYELDAYRAIIENYGGIDIQLIGTGINGHVGFHESGIPFSVKCGDRENDLSMLLVMLEESTREKAVEDKHFLAVEEAPKYALSMGADLIFKAKKIILLADGAGKAGAVITGLLLPVSENIPLSKIQQHPNATVVMDYAAGQGLVKAINGKYGLMYV